MDAFVEKIVARKLSVKHYLIIAALLLGVPALLILLLSIPFVGEIVSFLGVFALGGLIYLAYRLIRTMSIEFEYIVTNGDIDIDVITAKSKRKRIISATSEEIEIIAKYPGDQYTAEMENVPKKIKTVSAMTDEGIYFIKLRRKNENMIIYFQPDDRMLDAFRVRIPRKVFKG